MTPCHLIGLLLDAFPAVNRASAGAVAGFLGVKHRCASRGRGLSSATCRKVNLKQLGEDQPLRREVVRQNEMRAEWPMFRRGHDVVFEIITRSEAQYPHRFHPNILIRGRVSHRWVWLIRDGAREYVCCAAAGVRDVNRRNLNLLKCAVVLETQPRELANAQLIVDVDTGVNFLPPLAVSLNANLCVQQADFGGKFRSLVTRFSVGRGAGCGRRRGSLLGTSPGHRAVSRDAHKAIAGAIRRRGIMLCFTVSN